jgi:hypothetical protein
LVVILLAGNELNASFPKTTKKIIDYNTFEAIIWPKMIKARAFKKDWLRKFHPNLVYTEIISFIRGTRQALDTEKVPPNIS